MTAVDVQHVAAGGSKRRLSLPCSALTAEGAADVKCRP